jgi:hypothetical protein
MMSSKEREMGYKIITVDPDFRAQFGPRSGLEGPFFYGSNRVLYYCPKEGQYLNPQTDIFLTYEEYVAFTG